MEIEWLILADAAQAVGNKVYIMGGGWDQVTIPALGHVQRCGVAVSLLVPWNETNEPHTVTVELVSEDGPVLATVHGQLEVGRPAGIARGQIQRTILAMDLGLTFEGTGRFEIRARPDDREDATRGVTFTVVLAQSNAA